MPDSSDRSIRLDICEVDGSTTEVHIGARSLTIAGWTGRDVAAMEAHIAELAELGVDRPSRTPLYYRVASSLLSDGEEIQVVGRDTSGEVETVFWALDDGSLVVGVGSDHTDRVVEAMGVAISKQVCAKPVSSDVWRLGDVADHWDELVARSWATLGGERRLYQEGALSSLLPPDRLIEELGGLGPGSVLFGGTQPVIGGLGPADRFELELEDPVLGRCLRHGYTVTTLPVVS